MLRGPHGFCQNPLQSENFEVNSLNGREFLKILWREGLRLRLKLLPDNGPDQEILTCWLRRSRGVALAIHRSSIVATLITVLLPWVLNRVDVDPGIVSSGGDESARPVQCGILWKLHGQ